MYEDTPFHETTPFHIHNTKYIEAKQLRAERITKSYNITLIPRREIELN